MKSDASGPRYLRIAAVWPSNWERAQETHLAVCRWADMMKDVTFREWNAADAPFRQAVVRPLRDWKPHGLLVRMNSLDNLRMLRRAFPGVPIVSTLFAPTALVTSCVVSDIAEVLALARHHYLRQGLRTMALYFSGPRCAEADRTAAFRELAPDGRVLSFPHEDQHKGLTFRPRADKPRAHAPPPEEDRSEVAQSVCRWLRELPKPVGIIATEAGAAGFLLHHCRRLGLRVPADVQLIGTDNTEECLACEPHLTGINLPFARIGEMAVETMVRLLRRPASPPPNVIRVPGCTLTARDSTGLIEIGEHSVAALFKDLRTHAAIGLNAGRLAQLSGVGRTTLYKRFTGAAGTTPARYLRQQRIGEARRLLRESTASCRRSPGPAGSTASMPSRDASTAKPATPPPPIGRRCLRFDPSTKNGVSRVASRSIFSRRRRQGKVQPGEAEVAPHMAHAGAAGRVIEYREAIADHDHRRHADAFF
jgi:LacI family transcriptional regulator